MRLRLWALLWIVGCGSPQTGAVDVQPSTPPALSVACANVVETPLEAWAQQFEEARDAEALSALMRAVGSEPVEAATDQHGLIAGDLTTSVARTELSIGTLVHAQWRIEGDRAFEQNRLLIFRSLPRGASCLVDSFTPPRQEERCQLSGEETALRVSVVSLVAADVDALRVEYCSGGGGYGSDRSMPNTHVSLLGIEASALKEYVSFTALRWGGEAMSQDQRTTTSLTMGSDFPRTLTLHRVRECESTCEQEDLARRAREADQSDDESLYDALIQACALQGCWPLDEEQRFVHDGNGYSRVQAP